MEKLESLKRLDETLVADLNAAVDEANTNVLRAKAHGFDQIMALLDQHAMYQRIITQGVPLVIRRERKDQPAATSPEAPPTTEAPSAPEAAPTAPEEPSAAPVAPEAPPAPMPAEDPGPSPRRRGRPRKAITEDASPSLLPHSEPPAAPAEGTEPAEPAEPVESVTEAPQDMADDLPW